jgi:hypothetical protein
MFSLGIGDRFGQQGNPQLNAIIEAEKKGVAITPVWNKSNREHIFTGSRPEDVRAEADSAVRKAGFARSYFVDADHINIETAERFIESSDFFTIDVASSIGKRAPDERIISFTDSCSKYFHGVNIPGIKHRFSCSERQIHDIAEKYLQASLKAGEINRLISDKKKNDDFVIEVSMDEVSQPQTPLEIFFILKMLRDESIPVQTIAPKFSGRFNKGIDYAGSIHDFTSEFENDLMVVSHAIHEFGLHENLKISVHSGSDKFSIYPVMKSLLSKHGMGIHVKTAGTTWLEEVIGLSEAGGEALGFVKDIYFSSLENLNELCAPYSDVISIKHEQLPSADEVRHWNGQKFASCIRHNPQDSSYNPDMRQLMHIAYKLAARNSPSYLELIRINRDLISHGVFENLYERHICKLFPGL